MEKGERFGFDKGELAGKIHLLQELLGEAKSGIEELRACETSELEGRLAALQQ